MVTSSANIHSKRTSPENVSNYDGSTISQINSRKSQELIIGLCGAIGAGVPDLRNHLETSLKNNGYQVEIIKLSEIITMIGNRIPDNTPSHERYKNLQEQGSKLRRENVNEILAEYAIREVKMHRQKHLSSKNDDDKADIKIAYLIDQIKNPAEVELLRTVYKQNFYMIGINSHQEQRKSTLLNMGMPDQHASDIIEADRKEGDKSGQQVEDTFFRSDYFIHNQGNSSHLEKAVLRFLDLVHGINIKTPTKDEVGMYEAFSASLQSACLSRQVGSAIMSEDGDLLATGCNDVPVYGGGLYNESFGDKDLRCFFKGGQCFNDLHKKELEKQLAEILNDNDVENASTISEQLMKSTKAKDIIEYSRAIHAEMAAIMQLARSSSQSTKGTILYCTTYPCHNCARHIVAAGIHNVIYIEPYEKSLALRLHDDSISHSENSEKVLFKPFEGVSPKRYFNFFMAGKRKDGGKAIKTNIKSSQHKDPQYLDAYHDYEDRIVNHIKNKYEK